LSCTQTGIADLHVTSTNHELAIVVHAFYPDLFRELIIHLNRLRQSFKLFVSAPRERVDEIREALSGINYPFQIYEVENRGRDIAPFLIILPEIIREGFPFLLKLHTKKSSHFRRGDEWRENMYRHLIDSEQLPRNISYLLQNPKIGIIGPPDFIVPMATNWEPNQKNVKELARRMGAQGPNKYKDAFVAGTMFLARTAALEPLANLSIRPEEFEPETGQTDGTLAHAVERAISYSAQAAGYRIAGADRDKAILANYRRFGKVWKLKLARMFRRSG
jgi:lipopolysaccharide biosynthesis protein